MPVARPVRPFDLPADAYAEWLLTQSVGGSEIGAVLGCSEWATAADVFDAKLGLAPRSDPNHDMARGTAMEALVADIYAETTHRSLRRTSMRQRLAGYGFLHASPDRMIAPAADPSHPTRELAPADGPGVLEIKVPRWRGFDRVRTHGIAPTYYAQLQQYLFVKGCQWGSFGVFNADAWELYWFDVTRNDEYIAGLVSAARDFWENHMVPRVRPGPVREPLVLPPPRVGADAVYCADPAFVAALQRIRETQGAHQLAERQYEEAKDRLRALLGDAEALVGPGGVRVTHRPQTRTTYDMEALYRDWPQVPLAEYRRQTTTRPVLRVTFTNGG